MTTKAQRREALFIDALDGLLRVGCQFWACPGPLAPLRDMATCYRCRLLRRAWQMGIIEHNKGQVHMSYGARDETYRPRAAVRHG